MQFEYEAMTSDGRVVTERVESASESEAADSLRSKGMMIMRLGAASPSADGPRSPGGVFSSRRVKQSDLVLFTQQLKMLLEAGSALVPALEAIETQSSKASMKKLVREIRQNVEEGGSLTDAFQKHADIFRPDFCSMVSAGEATASLPEAFDKLNELTVRVRNTRKTIYGALLYPSILALMCIAVAGVVLGFVIPRFSILFKNLSSPLPAMTQVMFSLSDLAIRYWPAGLGGLFLAIGVIVVIPRIARLRLLLDSLLLNTPVIGRVLRRLIFARVLQVWAAMLRCHVPLLETIQHSRASSSNASFRKLIDDVEEAISGGGSIGRTLAASGMVEPVVASAIQTGEENGRLTEAVDFVSSWMDNDNAQLVGGLTRILEPVMLAVMGAFVGLVAMSLFLPLFDLAMAGGG